jgi:hypothetical protein
MKHYYIYHIPHFQRKNGKLGKIGCAHDWQTRVEEQGYTLSDCEILETHTDIYFASDREMELQREYGYRVDHIPYWRTLEVATKAGKWAVESGQLASIRSKGGKTGAGARKNKEVSSQPVLAYCKATGEFVGQFPSQIEAARQLGLNVGSIHSVLFGRIKQTGGYTFVRTERIKAE